MLVLDSFRNGHHRRRANDGLANSCSDDTAGVETIHHQSRRNRWGQGLCGSRDGSRLGLDMAVAVGPGFFFFFPLFFFFFPELRVEKQKTEEETGCDGNERPRRFKAKEGKVEVRSAKDEGQNCQLPKAKGKVKKAEVGCLNSTNVSTFQACTSRRAGGGGG